MFHVEHSVTTSARQRLAEDDEATPQRLNQRLVGLDRQRWNRQAGASSPGPRNSASRPPGFRNAWAARSVADLNPNGANRDQVVGLVRRGVGQQLLEASAFDPGRDEIQAPDRLAEEGAFANLDSTMQSDGAGSWIRSGIAGDPPPEPMSRMPVALRRSCRRYRLENQAVHGLVAVVEARSGSSARSTR